MGQVLHGSATTTEAVRRAIQNSQESIRALASRHGINPKTVAKWKKRTAATDIKTGPAHPKSTVLTIEEEAVVVAFRKHTLLPLDDCLYSLQATIPHLTRSSLHRCLYRHGINRLPDVTGDKPLRKRFKSYPIGYFHIDIAEVQTVEGKLYLYVAIDRTSKFAFVQVAHEANRQSASAFLEALIAAVPYTIHTILTDNGIQFTLPPRYADGPTARYMTHMFDMRCQENGIEHRLTKVKHPWTNGQVERMNRTIKEATVKRYHYDSHQQLETHLTDFINAYNYARRLKTLKGLTPYEYICKIWTTEPERFILNPTHQMPGLNTYIHDADTDAKKKTLFDAVNAGRVRILLGSTEKMGAGTNVQKKLKAQHHLDAPWRPRDIEQRDGRILRQGNENEEVGIYRYGTEGSFDAYMWQTLETKQRFISQVMSGDVTVREAEDLERGCE